MTFATAHDGLYDGVLGLLYGSCDCVVHLYLTGYYGAGRFLDGQNLKRLKGDRRMIHVIIKTQDMNVEKRDGI